MKIAFIYPAQKIDKKVSSESMPIGLLYLAALVEKVYGSEVDIYDGRHGAPYPESAKLNDYDVIGFTAMTMQISKALQIAGLIRKNGYKGKIVFGGPHASVVPEHLKQQKFIDAFFIGEAESTFPEYLKMIEGKPHKLERIWQNENGKWTFYEGSTFIEDLDSLPFPAREKYGDLSSKLKSINMTTARGCPFQCNYCQPTKEILFGKKVRRRSTENIIAEIRDAQKRFGIERFIIDDDTFTFSKQSVLEFCEAVNPLKLKWACQSRTDIDRETLIKMKDSGCDIMIVGAESGSQKMLDLMNKRNTVEKNKEFILTCNELGIKTACNMMAGYPGETEDDLKLSLEFIRETRPTLTNVSQVTPFPGTKLWDTNRDDIIANSWDSIARHVHKAKFKSLIPNQIVIKNYITLMNKRENHPVSAEFVDISRFPGKLVWKIPYLLRIIIHKEHWLRDKMFAALEQARRGEIEASISKLRKYSPIAFKYTKAEIYGHIAWLYYTTKQYKRAAKYYRKLLKLYPENTGAKELLCKIEKLK